MHEPNLVPARPQWDHAKLQCGVVRMLEAAVDAQAGRLRITEITIHDLEEPLDFGHGRLITPKPFVPQPLL